MEVKVVKRSTWVLLEVTSIVKLSACLPMKVSKVLLAEVLFNFHDTNYKKFLYSINIIVSENWDIYTIVQFSCLQ